VITTNLMPHQDAALGQMMFSDRVALWMFLGGGKSLTSLAWADALDARSILITSDKNNVFNTWRDQIYRHTSWQDMDNVKIYMPDETYIGPPCTCTRVVVLVNYDWLTHHWKDYADISFDLWIGDESTQFKNARTDRTKALMRVVREIPKRVILSGKPMTEHADDLFGQYLSLTCGAEECPVGRTMTEFRKRYMQVDGTGYGFCLQRDGLTRIKQDTAKHTIWMTEHPKEIQMPRLNYMSVTVEPTEDIKELDKPLVKEFAAAYKKKLIEVNHAASLFVKRLQLYGGVFHHNMTADYEPEDGWRFVKTNKLGVLCKLIEQNPDSKIVVWHHYKAETQLIKEHPFFSLIPFRVYAGPDDGDALQWFKDTTHGVLLIRNSMCRGLNQLGDADIVVFYSSPFSYQIRAQAEGRSTRLDSSNLEAWVVDLVTKGGPDEQVRDMLKKKISFSLTLEMIESTLRS